ncbi:hypothetical protein VULLAG_LOCUS14098 [Vulpes lagopus]
MEKAGEPGEERRAGRCSWGDPRQLGGQEPKGCSGLRVPLRTRPLSEGEGGELPCFPAARTCQETHRPRGAAAGPGDMGGSRLSGHAPARASSWGSVPKGVRVATFSGKE